MAAGFGSVTQLCLDISLMVTRCLPPHQSSCRHSSLEKTKAFRTPTSFYAQLSRIWRRSLQPELGHEATLSWERGEQDCGERLRLVVIHAINLDTKLSRGCLPQPSSDAAAVVFARWYSELWSFGFWFNPCVCWPSLPLEIWIRLTNTLGSKPGQRFPWGICECSGSGRRGRNTVDTVNVSSSFRLPFPQVLSLFHSGSLQMFPYCPLYHHLIPS